MLAQSRRGSGQSRLAAWQGFALLLLLTALALLYVKYQAVSGNKLLHLSVFVVAVFTYQSIDPCPDPPDWVLRSRPRPACLVLTCILPTTASTGSGSVPVQLIC